MGKKTARKLFSPYVWGNLLGIILVVLMLCVGVRFGIDYYTLHGESIVVPDLTRKSFTDAKKIMGDLGLQMVVADTGYVKELPADCILEQSPGPTKRVKSTHIIYVTINSAHALALELPDIIDNSSLREAQSKLLSMGFTVGDPEYRPGEKDWIYGVKVNGRSVHAGERIPKDAKVVIIAGDGTRDVAASSGIGMSYEDIEVVVDDDGSVKGEKPAPSGYRYEYRYEEVPIDESEEE